MAAERGRSLCSLTGSAAAADSAAASQQTGCPVPHTLERCGSSAPLLPSMNGDAPNKCGGSTPAPAAASNLGSAPWRHASSPELSAGWLSRLSFWWLNTFLAKGFAAALSDSDLYEVNREVAASSCADRFRYEWTQQLQRQQQGESTSSPRLATTLYCLYKRQIWLGGACKALVDGLQFLQPILIEWLLRFLHTSSASRSADTSPPAVWTGYVLAAAIGLNPLLATLLSNQYFAIQMRTGLMCRTGLITALYEKSLRLSPTAKQQMSVGQIVNMMSTDSSKVDMFFGYGHFLWSALLQVILCIALLLRALGPSALAGVAVLFVVFPLQSLVTKRLQRLRVATVKWTDGRVKLTNEILQGIRVIKLYVWESSFFRKLAELRHEEMKYVKSAAFTRTYNTTIMQVGPMLSSVLAFMTLALTSDTFEAEYIFSSLVLFNLLRLPLIVFPMALSYYSDAKVGIARIEQFLLAEEMQSAPEIVDASAADFAIRIVEASFAWANAAESVAADTKPKLPGQEKTMRHETNSDRSAVGSAEEVRISVRDSGAHVFQLRHIDLELSKGSLTAVVGAVGSGKSSLLAAILGEMRREAGIVQVAGSVGYCPQSAWIQNSTLKENIVFGLPWEEEKYRAAIQDCALRPDIAVLPAGDATEIGERGINLSGGQKQRVSLARAVYFDADIILLDDPLSAVDAHVSKYLFDRCIRDKLRNKTRVLVTHQLQYVSACDRVIFMEHGRISEVGTYAQLMKTKSRFHDMMMTHVGKEEAEDEQSSAVLSSREGVHTVANTPEPSPVSVRGVAVAAREPHAVVGDKEATTTGGVTKNQLPGLIQAEERRTGGVPLAVFLYYIRSCGGWAPVTVCFFILCLQTADAAWVTWWLGLWTNRVYDQSTGWYLGIYAGLGIGQGVAALLSTLILASVGIGAALHLHDQSFRSVLRAPMNFFETTPVGRILNRFSRDQDVIDSGLMESLRVTIFFSLSMLSTFVMICIVTPFFVLALLPILVLYYLVQKYFRATSRELKRLESISRSPLFAHFSETLTGLPTIRAYRVQKMFVQNNQRRMDNNNRSYYLLVLAQRWFSLRVETIGALISFVAALIVVIQRDALTAGEAGVSLTYAVGVTLLLNALIRQIVEAENNMNSVERSKFYTDEIDQEAPALRPEQDEPLKQQQWPNRGAIDFTAVELRYRSNLPLVLHGVSLSIRGGERIGIVGRTGAGKSSLMVAIFRLVEVAAGTIAIDGVDIAQIGLGLLRSQLAIIPQDAVLYAGSVRSNLDPLRKHSDAELWEALSKASIHDTIKKMTAQLDEPVSEYGENFSVGQRCQICLTRALLRNAKILIMDEATANIDMETDACIQLALREHFHATLLTIAHRLNTICDYDRVVVLDAGRIREFDTPANLLRQPDSVFSSMVKETGEVNASMLRSIAFKAERGQAADILQTLGVEPERIRHEAAQLPRSFPLEASHQAGSTASVSHVKWHNDND